MFTIQKYTLSLITRAINIQYLFDQAEPDRSERDKDLEMSKNDKTLCIQSILLWMIVDFFAHSTKIPNYFMNFNTYYDTFCINYIALLNENGRKMP